MIILCTDMKGKKKTLRRNEYRMHSLTMKGYVMCTFQNEFVCQEQMSLKLTISWVCHSKDPVLKSCKVGQGSR